jgi:hypothetical protein
MMTNAEENWLRKAKATKSAPVGVEWNAMMSCRDKGWCIFEWPTLNPSTWRTVITPSGLAALEAAA